MVGGGIKDWAMVPPTVAGGGIMDWAMVMAIEMTLANEKSGCEWAGHRPAGGDVPWWLGEGRAGLLATRVRGGWSAGLGEPGGPGEPGEPG